MNCDSSVFNHFGTMSLFFAEVYMYKSPHYLLNDLVSLFNVTDSLFHNHRVNNMVWRYQALICHFLFEKMANVVHSWSQWILLLLLLSLLFHIFHQLMMFPEFLYVTSQLIPSETYFVRYMWTHLLLTKSWVIKCVVFWRHFWWKYLLVPSEHQLWEAHSQTVWWFNSWW